MTETMLERASKAAWETMANKSLDPTDVARAVLEALREPLGDVADAGNNYSELEGWDRRDPADVWRAMIAAILDEETSNG